MINYKDVVLHKKKTYTQEAKGLLSEREYEVFTHLIDGETDTVISEWLNISLNTIKTHNRKIYRKLNVSGRLELIEKCS
jgi:LuxR family maltose regulon positive regulatory protein